MASHAAPWTDFPTTAFHKFSSFYQVLAAPHLDAPLPLTGGMPVPSAPSTSASATTAAADFGPSPVQFSTAHGPSRHPLNNTLYEPEGRWAYMRGRPLRPPSMTYPIKTHITYKTSIITTCIADSPVQLMAKTWLRDKEWKGFFSELYLYKTQLRPLQGIVVPNVITVATNLEGILVAMEPPHSSFWMTASPDMPVALKKRCVRAYELLHARGIAQTTVSLENILIGGDGRVTLTHFHHARGACANKAVELRAAAPKDTRLEMRRVRYLLDFEDAREVEEERHARSRARHARNQDELAKAQMDFHYVPQINRGSKEERLNPPFESDSFQRLKAGLRAYTPKRFVMPNQSAEELARNVRAFLKLVDEMDGDDDSYLSAPQPPLPFSLPPPPVLSSAAPRKRKNGPATSPPPAPKRLRPDMPPPPPPAFAEPSSQSKASSSRMAGPSSPRALSSSARASSPSSRASSRTRPVKKSASSPDIMTSPPQLTSLTAANLARLPGARAHYVPPEDLVSTTALVNYGNPYALPWQPFDKERSPSPDDPWMGASEEVRQKAEEAQRQMNEQMREQRRRMPPGPYARRSPSGSPPGSQSSAGSVLRGLFRSSSAPEIRDLEREEECEVERMLAEGNEGALLRIKRSLWDLVGKVL
ncbi:hypothetical protein HDZ31DRAFT_73666 [Schizophyllum fasciatum]